MVGLSPAMESNEGGFGRMQDGIVTPAPIIDRNIRNRFRPRIQAKGMSSLSEIPEINRRIAQNIYMNRRPMNTKLEPNVPCSNVTSQSIPSSAIDVQNNLTNVTSLTTVTSIANSNVRRDSISSNASSFYYSMKSADVSRRSSQTSQYSTMMSPPHSAYGPYGLQSNQNQMNCNASSFYDPISPGSSRRSSEMSTVTTGGHSLPPPPSSHLLSCHLQRLQQNNYNKITAYDTSANRFSVPCITPISNNNFNFMSNQNASMNRRMSEPVQPNTNMNNIISQKMNTPSITTKSSTIAPINVEQHPNREVDLDEVEEGEMVEDKLIIPEEFKNYLNQVADNEGAMNKITDDATNANSLIEDTTTTTATNDTTNDNINMIRIPENVNRGMWRDPSANLYPISPITQPHSPCSIISQGMPVTSPQNPRNIQQNRNRPPIYNQQSMPFQQYYDSNTNDYNNQMLPPIENNPYTNENNFIDNINRIANETNACTQTPGYYHRTDQSAMNCCHLLRELQLDDKIPTKYCDDATMQTIDFKNKGNQITTTTASSTTQMIKPPQIAATATVTNMNMCVTNTATVIGSTLEDNGEIQCGDISQSQLSPAVTLRKQQNTNGGLQQTTTTVATTTTTTTTATTNGIAVASMHIVSAATGLNQQQQQQELSPSVNYHSGMCQDAYQRTLEYVQSCQSWTESSEMVSSSTHPIANMTINDMTTSLNSLMEENRYLQMQQIMQ